MNQSYNPRDFCLTTYDRVNHSPTQMKYTFSKANRFPPVRQVSHVGAAYDIPGTNVARAAGMGFGVSEVFRGKRGKCHTNSLSLFSDGCPRCLLRVVFVFSDRQLCFDDGVYIRFTVAGQVQSWVVLWGPVIER